ncbi:MAG: type II toxin-antitoxin system Phd/YefM family antitoxin [Candidatus Marinimicrobia bacterium]|nr:type II toxin-antitoxin system Phd/YefM family antitoxin [bacterium]MCG2715697.1 type II toxin-antitoxin system Phd/YefM family antitoxin [Candidatus Neomarinimicrobiota bacterium]
MNTIPAQEIKRKGISAVDEELKKGAVHIIKNNRPQYVILDESTYDELIKEQENSYLLRIQSALEDIKNKKVKRFGSVSDFMNTIENYPENQCSL